MPGVGDPVVTSESAGGCYLEVVNAYGWLGDPRLGRFRVYVDGKAVGSAPVSGSLRVPVLPGPHVVRVRLRWYLSPSVDADAVPGQTVRLRADIARELSLLRRMARMLFRPFRSLSLDVLPRDASV